MIIEFTDEEVMQICEEYYGELDEYEEIDEEMVKIAILNA